MLIHGYITYKRGFIQMKNQLSPTEARKRNINLIVWTFSIVVIALVSVVIFAISSI